MQLKQEQEANKDTENKAYFFLMSTYNMCFYG